MNEALNEERRRARRVDASLSLQLHLDLAGLDDPGALETLNVSSTGVYFRSETYIEPMTKLSLTFDVATDEEGTQMPVSCEGIVARVLPELPDEKADGYEVAVFFTTIDAESLHHLERYIDVRLRR